MQVIPQDRQLLRRALRTASMLAIDDAADNEVEDMFSSWSALVLAALNGLTHPNMGREPDVTEEFSPSDLKRLKELATGFGAALSSD